MRLNTKKDKMRESGTDEGKRKKDEVKELLGNVDVKRETVTGRVTVHGNTSLQDWTGCWSKCTRLGYFAV